MRSYDKSIYVRPKIKVRVVGNCESLLAASENNEFDKPQDNDGTNYQNVMQLSKEQPYDMIWDEEEE